MAVGGPPADVAARLTIQRWRCRPGGGVAFRQAALALSIPEAATDRVTGMKIVKEALEAPMRQLLVNAGIPEVPAEGGVHVVAAEPADLAAVGILDSAAAIRSAVQAAAGVTTRFLKIA
ncbi:hypothetical protein GCM10023322_47410 [Rugosimonospora acidiphila]|uniref:TCP-1/cpn60 chaperonin family protein n=1 Tax=Rugosimonospora acidiphila TaxID=556531 RepID=A0ABP9S5A0_9ACTN